MNRRPNSAAMAFAVIVDGKIQHLALREHKARRCAQHLGGMVVPMIGAPEVARLLYAIDAAAGLGFVPGDELNELIDSRDQLAPVIDVSPRAYWHRLAEAHAAQATAHRLYALACRNANRIDDQVQNAIAHNDTQAGYFAARAAEARSMAEMAPARLCQES